MYEDSTHVRQHALQSVHNATDAGRPSFERLLDKIEIPDRGRHKPILILDGGLGTTLEDEYQVTFSSRDTPTWSSHLLASSLETLLEVHRSFVQAGADIILTATYQASFNGFTSTRRYDLNVTSAERGGFYSQEEAGHLMRSAIPLARSAFGSKKGLLALSLGAYGATMIPSTEYTGKYPPEMGDCVNLERWHAQRINVFEADQKTWNEVDLVAFETLPRVDEIQAVRNAMQVLSMQKPFWISSVFPNDDEKLPDGSEVMDVLEAMVAQTPSESKLIGHPPTPVGIGINCTKVSKLRSLIQKFEEAAASMQVHLPHLVLYPDGANNMTYDTTSQLWGPAKDAAGVGKWEDEMFDIVHEVQERDKWAGIVVGGCCKTRPQHIARLSEKIKHKR
ncbi:hypothetical protein EPUS_02544 [Endocarpon pusillum Z07020]|uniref:Hcy-binding domain-containing protein n=1 Tax=Endocarpon pusillum (strain Z07020 / HMAS-L-300199) TaxID=1263415 RepID=U1GF19_ENDPU|nr:uncharacterized protein EPUS_02544 [Endocarpon pusillum Z07020]ERF70678.1 hypothetical protein EPUS_02544 [Endocarpon pusillum Z07020]